MLLKIKTAMKIVHTESKGLILHLLSIESYHARCNQDYWKSGNN